MITAVRRQFEVAWALTEIHLSALGEDDFLWEPGPLCWTVRRGDDGLWRADFAEVEPDPVPVPTIGWLTWHVDFWWSAAIDSLTGAPLRPPSEVPWAGDGAGAVARLRALAARWQTLLDGLTEEGAAEPATFPWGADAGRTVADTVLWVTVELTKNAAEIGQLRLLRHAR
ncbi:DinB family protein [Mycobacterium sp. SMC-4]|uniref:DinB family protein n=1 Tax=Mycobacterium sp. SMC-4 TaxID=2857059 RepID=UPI003D01817A